MGPNPNSEGWASTLSILRGQKQMSNDIEMEVKVTNESFSNFNFRPIIPMRSDLPFSPWLDEERRNTPWNHFFQARVREAPRESNRNGLPRKSADQATAGRRIPPKRTGSTRR